MADAVRRQEHAGADFAQGRGLLVNPDIDAVGDQRVRCEQAADASADDNNR